MLTSTSIGNKFWHTFRSSGTRLCLHLFLARTRVTQPHWCRTKPQTQSETSWNMLNRNSDSEWPYRFLMQLFNLNFAPPSGWFKMKCCCMSLCDFRLWPHSFCWLRLEQGGSSFPMTTINYCCCLNAMLKVITLSKLSGQGNLHYWVSKLTQIIVEELV